MSPPPCGGSARAHSEKRPGTSGDHAYNLNMSVANPCLYCGLPASSDEQVISEALGCKETIRNVVPRRGFCRPQARYSNSRGNGSGETVPYWSRLGPLQTDETPHYSSSTVGLRLQNEGSIILLYPQTNAARAWVEEYIGQDNSFQPYWPTVVVEPRYCGPILEGIAVDGLAVGGVA